MRRLYKSRKYKVIDGVCGGIAEYFDIDPVIIRLIFVISIALGGTGVIAYIIGMIIIPHRPSEDEEEGTPPAKPKEKSRAKKAAGTRAEIKAAEKAPEKKTDNQAGLIFGIVLVLIGGLFLLSEFRFFHGPYYWIRNHLWDILIPSVLILLGINLILRRR
jgi:phage shock protein C